MLDWSSLTNCVYNCFWHQHTHNNFSKYERHHSGKWQSSTWSYTKRRRGNRTNNLEKQPFKFFAKKVEKIWSPKVINCDNNPKTWNLRKIFYFAITRLSSTRICDFFFQLVFISCRKLLFLLVVITKILCTFWLKTWYGTQDKK